VTPHSCNYKSACLVVSRLGVVEVELGGSKGAHHGIEDTELTGGQGSDHDATRDQSNGGELHEADLPGDVHQTTHGRSRSTGSGLVDLGQKGVTGVGDDSGGDSSNHTRAQADGDVHSLAKLVRGLAHGIVDHLSSLALNSELGHRVGDLLEEDRAETSVESSDALSLEHVSESGGERLGEGLVRHGADTDGLEGAEEEVSDELSHTRSSQVNVGAVVPRSLLANAVGNLNFEELNSTKLELLV